MLKHKPKGVGLLRAFMVNRLKQENLMDTEAEVVRQASPSKSIGHMLEG